MVILRFCITNLADTVIFQGMNSVSTEVPFCHSLYEDDEENDPCIDIRSLGFY